MKAIVDKSQAVGEFLEHSGYTLCRWVRGDAYMPVGKSIQEVLAEYFEIDLNKIEQEKRTMLDEIRKGPWI